MVEANWIPCSPLPTLSQFFHGSPNNCKCLSLPTQLLSTWNKPDFSPLPTVPDLGLPVTLTSFSPPCPLSSGPQPPSGTPAHSHLRALVPAALLPGLSFTWLGPACWSTQAIELAFPGFSLRGRVGRKYRWMTEWVDRWVEGWKKRKWGGRQGGEVCEWVDGWVDG